MVKHLPNALLTGCLLMTVVLLTNCNAPTERPLAAQAQGQGATPAPSAVSVVRHYADLLSRQTRLTTPASRGFADSLAIADADSSTFYLDLPACSVEARLDSAQRLERVSLDSPAPAVASSKTLDFSVALVGRLMRLAELRRAFGPGKLGVPSLTKERATRRYPVVFAYRTAAGGRWVSIEAVMPVPSYADSARVYSVSIGRL